ncbi:uncharacterized protein LOC119085486 [Bradysia coprophila]|uniref:uncharacterized protein LOC119085486 n=1 Tax=Bradysia coprophila TaxID=38358 RepID=UPI00187DC99D|nr:uncharacterized protein LOC119085486 [Bradysia coprophila]
MFQRLINTIFRPLMLLKIVTPYLDDLPIPEENGLLINWRKSKILVDRVTFLGFIVTNGEIRPSDEKVVAVRKFPIPKNVQQVQSFLGLTGFFRKFIYKYAIITRPLTELTKKDVKFEIGESQLKAIEELKTALCNEPVLKMIWREIFGNPYRIIADKAGAFQSNELQVYCENNNIVRHLITTGVSRGNGQVERLNRVIIKILSRMSVEDPKQWYKFVSRLQTTINSTVTRSTGLTPFELLVGVKMRTRGDMELANQLEEALLHDFDEKRQEQRQLARANIAKLQKENVKSYNRKRKPAMKYNVGDLVAIQRTQFGV